MAFSGSLPRMRGDPPASELSNIFICESTPHARGSTCKAVLRRRR